MKELNLSPQLIGNGTIHVYEGQAPVIRDPKIITINGTIDAPVKWLKKRLSEITALNAHVIVNREKLTISLVLEAKNYFGDSITGKVEFHPIFKKFNINTGVYLIPSDMAQLFKMNRSFFENQSTAMNLVSELQNFKAKVASEIEKFDDKRGNKRDLQDQVVNSNIPEKFNLLIPIFKGQAKQVLEIEVYINPNDLTCCLVSPAANDATELFRDQIIDTVINEIEQLSSQIVIIEE